MTRTCSPKAPTVDIQRMVGLPPTQKARTDNMRKMDGCHQVKMFASIKRPSDGKRGLWQCDIKSALIRAKGMRFALKGVVAQLHNEVHCWLALVLGSPPRREPLSRGGAFRALSTEQI
ncbi:hypothetical protein Tcan_10679 [Toxocara canis]|uniref:Uncharacterized protein n=1 Tax=Toxocara canis TaxID=6265 RepID=A0A0B2VQ18_TOXCA|nr:hypothetical protein Tcan_10679 [Toxocara canis]